MFLHAEDYGVTLKVLEILDKHLVLPQDIDLAKEFGQGLANYLHEHQRLCNTQYPMGTKLEYFKS